MLVAPLGAYRAALVALLQGRPDERGIERILDLHVRMAEARLGFLERAGRLRAAQFGLSLEDLALDSVAELFSRDEDGRFEQLVAYFEGAPLDDDVELLSLTRRLVWNAVGQALFRRHREFSPARSKLLRALKRALRTHAQVRVERVGRTLMAHVLPAPGVAPHAPRTAQMPPGRLAAEIVERLTHNGHARMNAASIVQAFVDVLGSQSLYAPTYPATQLATTALEVAVAIRHRSHVGDGAVGEAPLLVPGGKPDASNLGELDVAVHVEAALQTVKARLRQLYIDRKRLDERVYDAYFEAARLVLVDTFVGGGSARGGRAATLFEGLSKGLPGLTKEAYRSVHRTRLEYVSRCVREELLGSVRGELVASGGGVAA